MNSILTTSRLILRSLTENDAIAVASLINNERISRNLARVKFPYVLDDAHSWLGMLRDSSEEPCVRAITLTGMLIGVVGIDREPSGDAGDLGYWLGEPWWSRGYMTEATGALLDWAFLEKGFARITAGYRLGNEASRRVLLKLGFRHVGHKRIFSLARRAMMEAATVEITCREWFLRSKNEREGGRSGERFLVRPFN